MAQGQSGRGHADRRHRTVFGTLTATDAGVGIGQERIAVGVLVRAAGGGFNTADRADVDTDPAGHADFAIEYRSEVGFHVTAFRG